MATRFKLGLGSTQVDLLDDTKYQLIRVSPPEPHREKTISGAGCGTSSVCGTIAGRSASVSVNRFLYETRKMLIFCFDDDSYESALGNFNAIKTVVDAVNCGTPTVLIRQIGDQTDPTLWTVIAAEFDEDRQDLFCVQQPKIPANLVLDLSPGWPFVDDNGEPINGALSGVLAQGDHSFVEPGPAIVSTSAEVLSEGAHTFVE